MNQTYEQAIRESFSNMHEEMLLERKLQGGLEENVERWLDEEISRRGLSDKSVSEYARDINYIDPKTFPPNICFDDLAPLGDRLLAQAIDQAVAVIIFVIFFVIGDMLKVQAIGSCGILLFIAYVILSDAMPNGQTIGKKFCKIRTVDAITGESCSVGASFKRNLPLIFLGIIDWLFIFGAKRQRLGDRWAHTIVIVKRKI